MRELSRVLLYQMMIDELRENQMDNYKEYIDVVKLIKRVLNTNVFMLREIEEYFLYEQGDINIDVGEFILKIKEKIEHIDDELFVGFLERKQRKKPNTDSYMMSFIDYLDVSAKNEEVFAVFIKLLDELNLYSERQMKGVDIDFFEWVSDLAVDSNNDMTTKVFLSYAYDDKLYSWALYHYLKKRNVDLYVDWMHSPALRDAVAIKQNLQGAIMQSEQFLFLRTPKSEMGKGDSKQIRSWCSWEFGNFYGSGNCGNNRAKEKYYIQVYDDCNKKNTKRKNASPTIIDGLKQLSDVKNGRLV